MVWKRYIRTLKTLYPNFENVISEFWKRSIRTLKTLHPNFENVISDFWKRSIRTLTLKTLHPSFEIRYIWIEIRVDLSAKKLNKWTEKSKGGTFL